MNRKLCGLALFLSLFLAGQVSAANIYFRIPDGDVSALRIRLLEAQGQSVNRTILLLGGTFNFGPGDELPAIRSDVAFRGDQKPAYFKAVDGGPATLFRVEQQGSLRLANIAIEDFDLGVMGSGEAGLLINRGFLDLKEMQFRDNVVNVDCGAPGCKPYKPLVSNLASGTLRGTQLSLVDSGATTTRVASNSGSGAGIHNAGTARLKNIQVYLSDGLYEPLFLNTGQMWLTNVSLQNGDLRHQFEKEWITSPGRLQVSNSIIAGFGAAWCGPVKSAGYNLVDNPACVISSREDIVGEAAGLRWQAIDASWEGIEPQILTHALVPVAASPAVDSARKKWCPGESLETHYFYDGSDRSFDGDGDGVRACDRGAFELHEQRLEPGGINGLYYNPGADGHYVYISDTKFNTLVMWTTFDPEGRQAWIFGIAERPVAGRSLIADAYINRDGRVGLSGQIDPATSEHWGRIEVDMSSCDEGVVAFFSDTPGFGSGQFDITRLAHLKRLGCVGFLADD